MTYLIIYIVGYVLNYYWMRYNCRYNIEEYTYKEVYNNLWMSFFWIITMPIMVYKYFDDTKPPRWL